MLKGLWLTILGWFGKKADQATDLRYAGREHIRQVKNSIEEVRTQRNELAGRGILLENKIKDLESNVEKYAEAVRHHAVAGNADLKDKAYRAYVAEQTQLTKARADLDEVTEQLRLLDEQIEQLEEDTQDAKDALVKAANRQVLGRATRKVEGIHTDLHSGPLAGAIEESELNAASAEASRRLRKSKDNSDVLAYQTQTGVMSMDDLLGNTSTQKTNPSTVSSTSSSSDSSSSSD